MASDVDIKCFRGYISLFELMSQRYVAKIQATIKEKQSELQAKITKQSEFSDEFIPETYRYFKDIKEYKYYPASEAPLSSISQNDVTLE